MIEWISVKQKLPEDNMEVLVCNSWGLMDFARAKYHKERNIFVLYNPNIKEVYLLDVTHWLPHPRPPAWGSK